MLIRDYIIGFIAFTMLVVGGVVILSALIPNNPHFAEQADFAEFNRSFAKLSKIQSATANLEDTVIKSDEDTSWFTDLVDMIKLGYNSLKLIPQSFGFILTTLAQVPVYFGFSEQAWIFGLVIAGITIIIAFTILAVIVQREV